MDEEHEEIASTLPNDLDALPPELIDWSGWVYFSMAILVPLHSAYRKRSIHTLVDLRRATRSADMKASH
jgi:hypothetical protein